jgi:hypothetical protein
MPIKWSTLQVSEAMDMAEEFVNQAAETLEQAKIVASEAKKIANLPGYMDDRLVNLICDIERIDKVKDTIKAVRNAIPADAIEAERRSSQYRQPSLI